MQLLLDLFEVTVDDGNGGSVLLVVADSEAEARRLVALRGRVTGIKGSVGPLSVRGRSRIVGAVAAGANDISAAAGRAAFGG